MDHARREGGLPIVSTTFFHGTWVADPSVSPEAYAAFVRAVTRPSAASTPTSAATCPTSSATSPTIPASQALRPEDFDLGRIQLKEPGSIPEHEARWAWEWMASWGLMSGGFDAAAQINRKVEEEAHRLAAAGVAG